MIPDRTPAERQLFIASSGVGWGLVVVSGPVWMEDSGAEVGATSYRAELLALVSALGRADAGPVTVHTANDSIRRLGGDWIHRWKHAGWRKPGGPIEHLDVVQQLYTALTPLVVTWMLVDRRAPAFTRAQDLARHASRTPQARPEPTPPDRDRVAPSAEPSAARVVAYTDGGCRGNPGIGGWGFLLIDTKKGIARQGRGADTETTNNRMELTAAIRALEAVRDRATTVEIRTDSQYLISVATEWRAAWRGRGWRKANGDAVMNADLVAALDALLEGRNVEWRWIPGHSGEPGNEYADQLTNAAMDDVQRGRAADLGEPLPVSPVQVPPAPER